MKNRSFCEKRVYLNKSNTKWLSIGIKPTYHLLDTEGFTTEVRLSGTTSSPISLGDLNGLLSLYKVIRTIPYFVSYAKGVNADENQANDKQMPIGIHQEAMNGTPIFRIYNGTMQNSICMGIKSIETLFEFEQIIIRATESMKPKEIEKKIQCINEAATDFDSYMAKNEKEFNDMAFELNTNFSDLLDICIQLYKANQSAANTSNNRQNKSAD